MHATLFLEIVECQEYIIMHWKTVSVNYYYLGFWENAPKKFILKTNNFKT